MKFVVLFSVLLCTSLALDVPAEKSTSPDNTRTFAYLPSLPHHLQQIVAALNPMNSINAALSYLPTLPSLPSIPGLSNLANLPNLPILPALPALPGKDGTVTSTHYIQVTTTMTRHPVCMTAIAGSHPPPCAKFSKPRPHQAAASPQDAVHSGNGLGVIGSVLANIRPQFGFAASVPGLAPQQEVHNDDDWDFRELDSESDGSEHISIEPTVSVRIPQASAAVELPKENREGTLMDLEASMTADPEDEESESKRPHPRYIITKGKFHRNTTPPPQTVVKTIYRTVTEKYFDNQVTATLVAHNCLPGHVPFCPSKVYQHVKPTSVYKPHKPSNHYSEAHKPTPSAHYSVPHKPVHSPAIHKPRPPTFNNNHNVRPQFWKPGKDASDKIDTEVENEHDAIVT